ncbi:MAG TPA: EscU/YscU/HrcU family type III secretion system export apparatus switch protein [bacterium]|jgi:flagellar biosynthesis protein
MALQDEIRKAIALGYDPEIDRAPTILAKGAGPVADAILKIAAEHDIHIHEDPLLARSLYVLELGQEIPEDFYIALAEVLAFVYKLDKKLRDRRGI